MTGNDKEITRLRAEVERLRAALLAIREATTPATTTAVIPVHVPSIYSIACAALEEEEAR